MAEFKLPPISPLSGTSISNFMRIVKGQKIDPKFYFRLPLTILIILISTLLQWIDNLYFKRKLKNHVFAEPPIFIIGHWRSGTTLLHNLMTKDPNASFVTTYHSVFPNNLRSKWLFKTFMKAFMPDNRPGDNVKLAADFPQEDEYALSNMTDQSFYHFFYFPSSYKRYYKEYVRFESLDKEQYEGWKKIFHHLVIKANLNRKGSRVVLKNPVNTGRTKTLLEIFPDAKFIFIMRNPVTTYLSSKKFFTRLFPTLNLEQFNEEEIKEMILYDYDRIMKDYLTDKTQIPKDQLVEISFEEFESEPIRYLNKIYQILNIKDFEVAQPSFLKYIEAQKSHKMYSYQMDKEEFDLVVNKLDFAMKNWNYSVPENVDVV